ncbi:Tobamovirus multiplication protein 2A [Dichanthelium oligosanthes]|uniref:Tobamovirus multiplication protein 2A n=1 Tax=Dichanthelium oligosanthes TaxID=888268 RepID=A0A1E5UV76_9POAL|nr:Tobamovirus multiplication protein 2A [Dichanthelium oligosanthes]
MACRGFFECVLKLLNLVVMAVGLAMVGYGAYLLVMWLQVVPPLPPSPAPAAVVAAGGELVRLGRPLLLLVDASALSDGTAERLSSAWFIFAFIGVGVVLFITSIFGCAGARNGCCLSIVIPVDKTGNFDMMYSFLKENWKIAKWVALGAVVFEALLFTVAIIVQSGNQADYDSDNEYIGPRSGIRQPLVNQQAAADPRVPNLDYRPIRNDAWSQRMREKYGVDSFDPNRFQQATISPVEQRNRCTIL